MDPPCYATKPDRCKNNYSVSPVQDTHLQSISTAADEITLVLWRRVLKK
jgi:hypothetical protein